MKRFLRLLIVPAFLASASWVHASDPVVKEAQQTLSALGRYEGSIDGVSTAGFRTALRTFQHDRQLEATGELNPATREALKQAAVQKEEGRTLVAVPSPAAAEPTPAPAPMEPTVVPPAPIPPATSAIASDRELLETEAPKTEEAAEETTNEPLLKGTVYAEAEPGVQADVIRRAESVLRRHGLLQPDPDVSADALMEEAIFRFQSAERLSLTGRLDEPTLAAMRLLPREERQTLPGEWREGDDRPVEVFRGRVPRSRSSSDNPYPNAVRGIPLD